MFTTPFERQLEFLFIRANAPLGEPIYRGDLLEISEMDRAMQTLQDMKELHAFMRYIKQQDIPKAQKEHTLMVIKSVLDYGSLDAAQLMTDENCVLRRRIAEYGPVRMVYDVSMPRHQAYDEFSEHAIDKLVQDNWGIRVKEAAIIEVRDVEWLQRCGVFLDEGCTWISGPNGSTVLPLYRHVVAARKIANDFNAFKEGA